MRKGGKNRIYRLVLYTGALQCNCSPLPEWCPDSPRAGAAAPQPPPPISHTEYEATLASWGHLPSLCCLPGSFAPIPSLSGQCEMFKNPWFSARSTQQQPSHQHCSFPESKPQHCTRYYTANWLSPTWNQDTVLQVNDSFSCKKCVYFITHLCPPMWITPSLCNIPVTPACSPLDFCPEQCYFLNPPPRHSSKKFKHSIKSF